MLDNKDKKILSVIVNNARIPMNSLSKKIHISKELINYHIKKLESQEVIVGYQARLNLNAFSIFAYNILIKLNSYDKDKEKEFVDYIKKQKYTHFIAKIGGGYDFIISFTIKKISDLRNYLDLLYENFGDFIYGHQLFTYLDEIKDDFATLFDVNNNFSKVSMDDYDVDFKLDDVDKKIIEKITNNAKVSSVEIASELNMTSAAIAYRIKNLEKRKIILGYRAIIDILKLDMQYYYVFFDVKNPNKENEKKVLFELKSNHNILFANRLAGSHSYLCMIVASNNNSFYDILKEIQNNVSEIANVDIYSILDFIYQNYIPKGFLDD